MFRNSKKSSGVGLGQSCIPPALFPGSGLRGNCQPGLVCKEGKLPGVPICMLPTPSGPTPGKKPAPGPTPSGPTPSGPTPSGPTPPGTLGGACMPNVTISGRPLPRCAPPAKCDTNDGSSTFGKCILPPPSGPATKSGMGSKEILTIIGLIFLGLCFLCGLAKMGMKDAKRKGNCDKACGAFVFLGVALIAVSSVLKSSN